MENLDPNAWIERAKYDLKGAEHSADSEIFDHAVFWCQQAAEKALKAVYIKKTGKLKKVHDLVLLAREVGLPPALLKRCKELTLAYVYTRYPDFNEDEDIEKTAEEFLSYAKEVITWSEKQL